MGLATQRFHSTTLCEHLYCQEPKLQKKCRPYTRLSFQRRLLANLSHFAPHLPSTHVEPNVAPPSSALNARKDGPHSASQDLQNELNGHDQWCSGNPINDVHNGHDVCISNGPSAAASCVDGVRKEQSGPCACGDVVQNEQSGPYVYATPELASYNVHPAIQHKCTSRNPSNIATDMDEDNVLPSTNPSEEVNLPSDDAYQDEKVHGICTTGVTHDVKTSRNSSSTEEVEAKGKIRRFSLNEPGLLNTLQEARALTPLEQENLDLLMKFKLTNDNVKGRLVIRAVRTEQLRDLENLLTDSYSELMWGPLTYRPVLAWILSTYLRERQAYLPHAVTLVGLYAPSDESNDPLVSSHKWWLAGAVEISFNASGKPKDIQTPMPPEDTPFLSNMAVLKRFRRRGIGQELLKAAEQLVVQMGGNEMYLHCRMVDEAPLTMYKNAGYAVVETDSILSLLLCQRRRHLMYKTLATPMHQRNNMVPVD